LCCLSRREQASAGTNAEGRAAGIDARGLFTHHVTGSHYILKHPAKPLLRVTLPWHNKDLKRRTLTSIIEQSGGTPEEFLDLL
jgi:predicted RNA binding protein YcfA (HicA-like mRNA interferase family)